MLLYQEDITIISLYAPSNRLKLYKAKIDRMKRELALKKKLMLFPLLNNEIEQLDQSSVMK